MERVLPQVAELAALRPERTVFTRMMPPARPEEMWGVWRRYYEKWRNVTREQLDPSLVDLMPPLAALVPPAVVIDKPVYSAFAGHKLVDHLRQRGIDTLIVTGSETDMCVLSTVLGAVDHGYRVIIVRDCLCSSSDEGHDSLLKLYHDRFSIQIETADAAEIMSFWR
jgi:nicotinamidase-related amidase